MFLRGFTVLVVGLLFAALSGCDKPNQNECKEACSRILQIAKEDYDKKVAQLPDDWKRRGWLEVKVTMDPLVDNCASACFDAGQRPLVDCLKAAKTSDEFIKCTAIE